MRDAAVEAGAPPDIISWIEDPSLLVSQALMQAPQVGGQGGGAQQSHMQRRGWVGKKVGDPCWTAVWAVSPSWTINGVFDGQGTA